MDRRSRLARPLWPGVLAAVIASTAVGQSQPASPPAPPNATAPAPGNNASDPVPANGPAAQAPGTVPGIPSPTPEELAAEEAERKRRREAVGGLYAEDSDLARQSEEDERSLGMVAFQTFLSLGIVILLVYLTLNYGVRRMMGLRPITGGSRVRLVDVVERVALDQKKAMYVVKVAGEYLLVGGSDGGLSLISKLDPEAIAKIQRENAPPSSGPVLSPFLQKLLSRRDGTPPKAG